ncbi:MAG: Rsd/AlgQ family anti-sigma factor [Anaerobiospirillum sp.]|nr:Rsd/AlgQ family anti-sigma factor [Anaerobiospirillum sp.]
MATNAIHGFNTTLQQVDSRYEWINDMIRLRQGLVLKYMQLLGLAPQDPKFARPELDLDQEGPSYPPVAQVVDFCNHLTDYVSHGHFDLFPKLVELLENASGRSLSIAQRVLPKLDTSIEQLMDFSDKYCEHLDDNKLDDLQQDLEKLGPILEQRFRNEDRLIIALRLVHAIVATV